MDHKEAIQAVKTIGNLTTTLYEFEAASEKMVDLYFKSQNGVDDEKGVRKIRELVGELDQKARELRIYLTSLQSTLIVHHSPKVVGERAVEQYGFSAYVDNDAIEISIPYQFITATSTFLLRVKNYSNSKNMMSNTNMWHFVMDDILTRVKHHAPFEMPLKHASIQIVVYKPDRRIADPDHFWKRPVLDSLVNNRIILDDNTDSLDIYTTYLFDLEYPEIRIRIKIHHCGRMSRCVEMD